MLRHLQVWFLGVVVAFFNHSYCIPWNTNPNWIKDLITDKDREKQALYVLLCHGVTDQHLNTWAEQAMSAPGPLQWKT